MKREPKITKTVQYDGGGWFAEVYDADTDCIGRWYGTREDCEALDLEQVPLYPRKERPDPFDLACERRHD